jgi:hypothetical protein
MKYFWQIDFYWKTKATMSQLVEEYNSRHIKTLAKKLVKKIDIQQVLEKLDFLDKNYEALVKLL